jgi:hypothetical protein
MQRCGLRQQFLRDGQETGTRAKTHSQQIAPINHSG